MKELEIIITSRSIGKPYKVNLDDELAEIVESELEPLLQGGRALDAKVLLTAFIQKCYENSRQTREMDDLIEQIRKEFV